jgi:hypothetical protein
MKVMHEAHMRLLTGSWSTSYEAQTYGFDEAHMKLIDIALSRADSDGFSSHTHGCS